MTADEISAGSAVIAALSLVVSAIALIYNAKSVNASRRAIQLQIFDGVFRDIKRLDVAYSADFRAKGTKPTSHWCYEFFNTIEYMAFLLNRNMILRNELHDFYREAVVHWHKTFAENSSEKDRDNPSYFPEFKKLYQRIKADAP